MDPLHRIAERKIEEALKEGVLDDYAGKGEPMELEDLSNVPDDLRAGYILMKGAGALPEEIDLKKGVLRLGDLIAACTNDAQRRTLIEERDALVLRYEISRERRGR